LRAANNTLFSFGPTRCHSSFFALVVIIDERARAAIDFDTSLAIGAEAMIADEWANTRRFTLYRVERIDARYLYIELHPGVFVEEIERLLRGRVPIPVYRSRVATDPPKFTLQSPRKIHLGRLLHLVGW